MISLWNDYRKGRAFSPTFFLYPLTNLEGSAVYVVLIRMTLVSLL